MKILVTGATGFTGVHFSRVAQLEGYTVVPLRSKLTNTNDLTAEIQNIQPEVVVHLAGISFVGGANHASFYEVNTVGTINLLQAVSQLKVKPVKVLIASSANVYGNCVHSPINESQSTAPVNHYAASKLAMEHMALTYTDRLPIILCRLFNYTGTGQSQDFIIPKLVHHFGTRQSTISLGNLDVEREYNDVLSVCDNYITLINNGIPGEIYNICSGVTYSLNNIIKAFTHLTKHEIQIEINPAFIRPNEIRSLCGNPDKLSSLYKNTKNPMLCFSIENLFSSMLKAYE